MTPRIALLVEDSEPHASNLAIALAAIPGLEIAFAQNGREAIRFLNSPQGSQVCAVLTDVQMPLMDGLELVQHLRSEPGHKTLPIVVFSGSTDPDTQTQARRAGANAFFMKPYSPLEVRKTLERLLNA